MKRRFIAGAVCPRCASLDSIYVFQIDKAEFRACCECDFEEKADFGNSSAKSSLSSNVLEQELPTRVNNTEDPTRQVDIDTVRIIGGKGKE